MRRLDGTQIMWVLIHENSSIDTEVTVFDDIHVAITAAQVTAHENAYSAADIRSHLTSAMIDLDWVYNVYYGEDSSVRVVEKVVQSVQA